MAYSLTLENITKLFGRQLVFKNINYHFEAGKTYGFAGSNGSGKSTLTKIIAGVLAPNKGKVIHKTNDSNIPPEKLHEYIGFVSPYLILYDEFTALENLLYFASIRGIKFDEERTKHLFNLFKLYNRRNDLLKGFSSGMKQRMKYIFALQHNPKLLLLDEPTSNLDEEGKEKVYEIIKLEEEKNVVIVASNEKKDLELCADILEVENYK